MIRGGLCALIFLAGVVTATSAVAHASLVSSYPSDSAVLEAVPDSIALTFNEPVSLVALQLTDADGQRHPLTGAHLEGNSVVAKMPADLPQGTDALSWRVVSTDGHPIGGTLIFSVGHVGGNAGGAEREAPFGLYPAIWIVDLVLFAGLFIGVGGSFFAAWIAPRGAMPPLARRIVFATLAAGMVAAPLALGLEGLDVLWRGLDQFADPAVWAAGLATSFTGTTIASELAFLSALAAIIAPRIDVARGLAAIALAGVGLALSLSGHANDSPAQTLAWAAMFLHGVGVAFWSGSLIPLGLLLWRPNPAGKAALVRFSRAIPFAIAPLIVGGVLLTLIEFTSLSDFWTTNYGLVLLGKLAAVAALLGLAAANRFAFTAPALRGDVRGTLSLRRSIGIEIAVVVVILGLVGLWRFTPPPRAVAASLAAVSAPSMTRVMTSALIASVTVTPGRVGPVQLTLSLTDTSLQPFAAKVVSVDLANPDAGIAAITRRAVSTPDGAWQINDLTLPVAGTWRISVTVLITDFEQTTLEGPLVIRW